MAGMKISELEFARLLPTFMRDDEAVIALSRAVDRLLGEPGKRLHTIRTWDQIDELNEAECDELAWELDIDWYDSTGMSLREKRETIKVAQQIKRKRGTKWSVEGLISAYFGTGYVQEWYESGGAPYTFMVFTTNATIGAKNYDKFMEAITAAKNERSHLVRVFYLWEQDPAIEYALSSESHKYGFDKCGTRDRPATLGFIVKNSVETEPDDNGHLYSFKRHLTYDGAPVAGAAIAGQAVVRSEAGAIKSGTYPRASIKGAVMQAVATAAYASTHAVYDFPKCGANGYKARIGPMVGTAVVGRAIVRTYGLDEAVLPVQLQ